MSSGAHVLHFIHGAHPNHQAISSAVVAYQWKSAAWSGRWPFYHKYHILNGIIVNNLLNYGYNKEAWPCGSTCFTVQEWWGCAWGCWNAAGERLIIQGPQPQKSVPLVSFNCLNRHLEKCLFPSALLKVLVLQKEHTQLGVHLNWCCGFWQRAIKGLGQHSWGLLGFHPSLIPCPA